MFTYNFSDFKNKLSAEWFIISDDGIALTSDIVYDIWYFLQNSLGNSSKNKFIDFSNFVCKDFYVLLHRIYADVDYATIPEDELFNMIKSYIEDELDGKLVAYSAFDFVIYYLG